VPLLLDGGAGGLVWRRIRQSPLANTATARQLRDYFRLSALQSALYEQSAARIIVHLRSATAEPLLAKGWAVARLYPMPGLRPCGDIDLCVRPEHHTAAAEALGKMDLSPCSVDLHSGVQRSWSGAAFSLLDDRSVDDLYEHSVLIPMGEVGVRVLGPEDHLRLLCLHTLSHGAWRSLWLCDIAVAMEGRPPEFDWDRCLGGDPRRSHWVACALGLAHQLLGARIDDTPVAEKARRLPHWLVSTVLRQWGQIYQHRLPMANRWPRPVEALRELRHHWPNGIEATVDVRGPFNSWPRTPFQLAACVARTADFMTLSR
jgi:hypothetical protein